MPEDRHYHNPAYLLFLTAAAIFVAETLVMFLLSGMPRRSAAAEALLDALLLVSCIVPVLFIFLLKPLRALHDEQKRLIVELQKALQDVKTLSGLVPICSSCKKIRDDKGYWNQLERYITEHTDAQFTHGLCPDCAERLYPQYYRRKEE